ncbi:uncharacterized protein KD926_002946 [Aspergillus affinis]|uniref:uncharacterized protein n=1 Tax=Aspergillus affinis TaxID=1070780 RepID=UPI0022FF1F6B|nr:uncharacterized protein KD926_002946 [Aspergillus affinis]KAI9035725.1 hypothetical protein KD926_002946 [Aspergillus affinis]
MAPIKQIEYFRVPPRWLFVKITDANGNFGWGEASLEGHSEAVEGALDAFIERFTGMDADEIENIWQNGYRMGFYRGGPILMSALSGIDIALWDLKGRRLGLPVYEFLGGKVRDKLKVYAWIGGDRPGDVEAQAQARISQGFKAIKMNATEDLGWLDSPHALDASVERLKTVKALGIDAGVDFHGRVHKAMALQLAHKLTPHEPLFIEEPLLSEHPESISALSKLVPIPIALGERLHSRWDIKPFLESASVSILQPDISHVGGISELRRMATMAEAYDVALAPHCPLGPIALAANIHVDAVSANFAIQEMSLGIHYNAGSADIETYIKNPEVWNVQDGLIDLITGPGLGIEIDEDKVRAASVNAVAWRSPAFRGPGGEWREKKLRCSGTLPCSLCQRSGQQCKYNAGYTRGKLPPIPLLHQAQEKETAPTERVEMPPSLTPEKLRPPPAITNIESEGRLLLPTDENANVTSSRNSPEPHQTDMEGHYVGPSSGVSFLIRVQKRLHQNVAFSPNTTIFSFGDAPLPKYDASFLVLPTKEEAKALLNRYFDFGFPTHRFLHQQTTEGWLEGLYGSLHDTQSVAPGAREVRALLLMLFLQAKQYLPRTETALGTSVNSAVYFGASEHHLSAETGPVRLTSVQARLAQCFYLLSQSRINHCWSLFGTTARLAIAIGLHRKRRREHPLGVDDFVDQECRKRVFWCAYSLDNYLSAALGRPRIFHDNEIDQELPAIANDSQIRADAILPATSNAQSIMLAPVYHAKLSRIISGILRDLYGIQKTTLQMQMSAAAKYGAELSQWRKKLSAFLDLPSIDMLITLYQRQYNVLNLAFSHAQILLYRPFVLKNFAVLASATSKKNEQLHGTINENVQSCLNAAMKIVGIVRDLCEHGKMYHAFWFTHYYAFSAIVVLYVHVIQNRSQAVNIQGDSLYFQAGEQAQKDLATCGSTSSFAQRYVMVLEELRKEAQESIRRKHHRGMEHYSTDQPRLVVTEIAMAETGRQRDPDEQVEYHNSGDNGIKNGVPQISGSMTDPQTNALDPSGIPLESQGWMDDLMEDTSPASYIADLTSWGEFDSLALTGLGELGFLFPTEGSADFGM